MSAFDASNRRSVHADHAALSVGILVAFTFFNAIVTVVASMFLVRLNAHPPVCGLG